MPPGRIAALARFAKAARAQAVAELADNRRQATLVAFAATMEPLAADEAIEVFDLLMGDLLRTSGYRASKDRLRSLKELDDAAILLRRAWLAISQNLAEDDAGRPRRAGRVRAGCRGQGRRRDRPRNPTRTSSRNSPIATPPCGGSCPAC